MFLLLLLFLLTVSSSLLLASTSASSSTPKIFVPPPPECYDPQTLIDNIESLTHPSPFIAGGGDEVWNDQDLRHPALPDLNLETPGSGCQLKRVPLQGLTKEIFREKYLEKEAIVITGNSNRTAFFKKLMNKNVLLHCFGSHTITLSTANQFSYDKTNVLFREYVEEYMSQPQSLNASGKDTLYHFGDNKHSEWEHFFSLYPKPTEVLYDAKHATLSFGLASTGTGVPSHTHGHVFAEVFYGKKRWWIAEPRFKPRFDSDESVLRWLLDVFPNYTDSEKSNLLDCTISPGDIIYIPTHWWHSTFNIGDTVFMSTFV